MKKYYIRYTTESTTIAEVEAENKEEAIEKWERGDYDDTLDYDLERNATGKPEIEAVTELD